MSRRLASLDAFRGLTIAAMILVNNPGSWAHVYAPLRHAKWHGCTPTDLVFPFFVFIVGVAIVLSRPKPVLVILSRGLVLWALGLVLAGFPYFELGRLRILGVLPRLGICYALAALLHRRLGARALLALVAVLLLGYWILMASHGSLDTEDANLAARLDRALLAGHMWKAHYDPEGILSTLPALCTALFGVLAGRWLQAERPPLRHASGLALCAVPLVALGLLWGLAFPINKPLWTSSYCLYTAGLACGVLAFLHWLIEARGHRAWAKPLVIYGVNAITVFVGSGLLAKTLHELGWKPRIYEALFTSWLPPHPASLGYALAWVLGWFAVLAWMWRRGIVLRV